MITITACPTPSAARRSSSNRIGTGSAASHGRTLAALLAAGIAASAYSQGTSLVLSDGQTASNAVPAEYASISLIGAGTTYSADAALALTGSGIVLRIEDQAQFIMNASVNAVGGSVKVSNGGSFRMNAGMLTASSLSLQGAGSFIRTGGSYDLRSLLLDEGASISYGGSDSITDFLSLRGASTMTLAKDLSVGSLEIRDGSSISRTAATVSVSFQLDVAGSSFEVRAGDSIAYLSATAGADVRNGEAASIASGMYLGALGSSGVRATYTADATLAVGQVLVEDGGSFVANADVDAVGSSVSIRSGGELRLNGGTLRADSLALSGAGSMLRSSGSYEVGSLEVYGGASVAYLATDSITDDVSISGGSSLVLGKDLEIRSLYLAGGGSLTRGSHAIRLTEGLVASGADIELLQGDAVGGSITVYEGAMVRNTIASTLANGILVSGLGSDGEASTYSSDADLSAASLVVSAGAIFNMNANVDASLGSVSVSGGSLRMSTGTLSAGSLNLTGTDAFTRTGGSYAANSLFLSGGAATTFESGDSITYLLGIVGAGSMLTSYAMLDLEVLQLTEGGTLALAGFTGSWNGLMVGLQLVGDQRTSLEDYRTQGLLAIIGSPADVTIAYDLETDTTYVAVPAPGTLLVVALTGIVGLRGRPARRRN